MSAMQCLTRGEPCFCTSVTAGYPSEDDTVPILLEMQTGGADIIKVGVPFSDPIADRPAIQETNLVTLQNGVDYETIFAQIKSRSEQRPYVSGYYNPILACGEDKALQDARDDGANGCIMVDLPPEEASGFCEKYVKLACLMFFLCYRLPYLAPVADPFIYIVSRVSSSFIFAGRYRNMHTASPRWALLALPSKDS
ncbi:hypothetical protein BKA82DRAFT_481447 [Pisolithus tinctorius]|nr:hypothetical protein BKA82DRAFT_481447 [Pisolithus tinctorius]